MRCYLHAAKVFCSKTIVEYTIIQDMLIVFIHLSSTVASDGIQL
uniref:Uncharacterized protein n=1 Tax=Arundo donax TaxID=35708 RepID=A0A0A8YXL7_ARUDO